METKLRDCVVIGGGPAGLTAAIYLSRYHLSVTVFDDGLSRAASIPVSHNHAGFPDGIGGEDLLSRMREQATKHGVEIVPARVTELSRTSGHYSIVTERGWTAARTVLIATGVVNRRPPMPSALHDEAVARGLIRYCPVCDGYEVTDKAVAVIGLGSRAFDETIFLRSYTKDLTLLSTDAGHGLTAEQQARLVDLGVKLLSGPLVSIDTDSDAIHVTAGSVTGTFATVYPALGSDIRSELACMVGAALSDDGCVIVDSHQRTSVQGLYAAGDVVIGLDQISHAMGQAGVAATAIRNDLCQEATLIR